MTAWLLLTFPSGVLAVVIVLLPTILVMLGVVAVRRRYGWETLSENNDQGGVLFSIVGTIYAIFLAFLVVVAWDQLNDAEQVVEQEGATVLSLYRDAGAFSEPTRGQLRGAIKEYARAVVDQEWDEMARGRASQAAADDLEDVWGIFLQYTPTNQREQLAYQEALARLNELGKQRKLRVLASQASLPTVFWALLIFGAIVTLGFTLLLGMRHLHVQLLMTGVLTAIVMSALFLIVMLDCPFTGDIRAEPDAFIDAIRQMERTRV